MTNSPMSASTSIDVVYERQWRPMPYPVFALQSLGRMGYLYGGFPKKRYTGTGIPGNLIRTFPLATMWNYALARTKLPTAFRMNEAKSVGNWVACQKDLAPTVWANGTAHCYIFPRLRDTGRILILERGSTHPENVYLQPQMARKEAGYSYDFDVPTCFLDEIEKTKLAHGILAASEHVRQTYVQRGFPEQIVHNCSFGIDTDRFAFIERSAAHGRPVRIAVVGLIGFRKGIHRILKIGDWAARKGLPLEIHFAGPIESPEAYEMFSKSRARCVRHGVLKGPSLMSLLRECDLYALPSYEEGLPFSVLEAMSTGLAAIVSNDTGAREPVEHRKSGLVLKRFDDDEFDAELARILIDPGCIPFMGRAARTRIEENYTLAHYYHRLENALKTIEQNEF